MPAQVHAGRMRRRRQGPDFHSARPRRLWNTPFSRSLLRSHYKGNAELRPERRLKCLNGRGGFGRPRKRDPPIQSKAYSGQILVLKTGATLLPVVSAVPEPSLNWSIKTWSTKRERCCTLRTSSAPPKSRNSEHRLLFKAPCEAIRITASTTQDPSWARIENSVGAEPSHCWDCQWESTASFPPE